MHTDTIRDFYEKGMEEHRLEEELFKLEGLRTKEIISRYLIHPSMQIADIGGAAGHYAFWLQSMGHRVTLLDLSPKNIELAKVTETSTSLHLNHITVGDATNLPFADGQFDLVILLGPLHHLTEKPQRIKALTEARRIAKRGAPLLAAIISRYASLFDGFMRDLILDDEFEEILSNDLSSGVHLNNTNNPEYFTTAYFHSPQEIRQEINESNWNLEALIAVESFGWMINDFKTKSNDIGYMT